jgi:hypothetical protein
MSDGGAVAQELPVCRWADGWELRRGRPGHGLAGPDGAVFRLTDGEREVATVVLRDLGLEYFPDLDLYLGEEEPNRSTSLKRLRWFFWTCTPEHVWRKMIRYFTVLALELPRDVSDRVLLLEKLEERALDHWKRGDCEAVPPERLYQFSTELLVDGMSLAREAAKLLETKLHESVSSADLYFEAWDGALLRLRYSQDPAPMWSVVEYDDDEVFSTGRTPLEAIRGVPFLVWPGQWEEWAAKNLLPGELAEDPEVYLLLSTWPPCLLGDSEFWERR